MSLAFASPSPDIPRSSPWTDERVDLLKKRWAEGASASAIAAELGGGIRRNAVIGKVHRLGLSGVSKAFLNHRERTKARDEEVPAAIALQKPRSPGPQPGARLMARLKQAPGCGPGLRPAKAPHADADIPIEQRKTLMELTNQSCRFPYGDPGTSGFFFCGAPEADMSLGRPYCAHHTRRAAA